MVRQQQQLGVDPRHKSYLPRRRYAERRIRIDAASFRRAGGWFPRKLFWPASEAMRRIRNGEFTAAHYAESSADPLIGVRRIRGLFYVDLASRQG